MGRRVRDTRLETREARLKLKPRAAPYWRSIHPGLHLGYYKGARGGTWIARAFDGSRYFKQTIGPADDTHDADGITVLTFAEAQKAVLELAPSLVHRPTPGRPYTIGDAIQAYLAWYQAHKKAYTATAQSANAHILPKLGDRPITKLTREELRNWHQDLAHSQAMLRKGKHSKRKTRETNDPRARRATANRVLTILKAALNLAFRDGKVPTDEVWRGLKPFRDVDAGRVRYLSLDECRRLINGCASDLRRLVQAALLTGCRYGELMRLKCSDFVSAGRCLVIRESKSGKPRTIPLTHEGIAFFEYEGAGRPGDHHMFLRSDGRPWGKSHQQRPLNLACAAAKIDPPASFHVLRHSYASALAMQGCPLQVIAAALGHADTRITEKHYAHLMPSYIAETIREKLPELGIQADGNLRSLTAKPKSRMQAT